MDWTKIIIAIVGTGILTTIVNAIITRRERTSKNDGIDIKNLKELIDILTGRVKEMETQIKDDREETHKYIVNLREEILSLRKQREIDTKAILQAYRCQYPKDIKDCPVIKAQAENACSVCTVNKE